MKKTISLFSSLLISAQIYAQSQFGVYYQASFSRYADTYGFAVYPTTTTSNIGLSYGYQLNKWLYTVQLEHLRIGSNNLFTGIGSSIGQQEHLFYFLNASLNGNREIYNTSKLKVFAGFGLNLGHAYAQSFESRNNLSGIRPFTWYGAESLPYNFYLAPELGLRFEYGLFSKLALLVAPEFSYQIMGKRTGSAYSHIQVNAGLLYRL